MYKPAPPRPKKTSIVRSRTGCKLCRHRRVKCDETKPSCGACTRAGKACEQVSRNFEFSNRTLTKAESAPRPLQRVRWQPFYKSGSLSNAEGHRTSGPYNDSKTEDRFSVHKLQDQESSRKAVGLIAGPVTPDDLQYIDRLIDIRSFEKEQCYLVHWEGLCIGALDRLFCGINALSPQDHALNSSLLALAACNMSRRSPEGYIWQGRLEYVPHRDHQLSSQRYYSSAVGETARALRRKVSSSPLVTLATLVLFCFMETAMGNFRGFGWHCRGIAQIIDMQLPPLANDALGKELIVAWLASRLHMWWRRMYFTSFSLQLHQGSLLISPQLMHVLRTTQGQKTLLTTILCESHRLNTIATLQDLSDSHARDSAALTLDECLLLLEAERRKLDEWHSHFGADQPPSDALNQSAECNSSEFIHPLFFKTHDAAMNYAYYVAARILQCTEWLHHEYDSSKGQQAQLAKDISVTTSWVTRLLRTVVGLDIFECARRNSYSIGIASLLLACVLKCDDLKSGTQAQHWLQKCVDLAILEEGSFPIAQTLEVVRIINEERAAGRDVYAIGLPEDDGGGSGKYSSYNSQRFRDFVILGRVREDDSVFSEQVSMDGRKPGLTT
ncbi:Zn(II)2Cys6 transcription factor domain-containing protein [Aspergillus homomorphus CBS 101889]|uniref:Zn(2)-C6 fungal-type domain-containing protein n=1 Tax=Aspergillus homomorphus (strain CBS 101889) TaxID=1450537 RepID=A0A395I0K1_ASPHC|nr:hypothetical protein BO97DRAFT_342319 [Aspergillus homomorphus CBS 101889]RAL13721.1 hypothetical protein BO97DRAFT_342319 [Aspergillus homomorphus CBS 101889]